MKAASAPRVSPGFIAGSSLNNIDVAKQHSWSSCDASSFMLRVGPNYERNKRKEPSPPALMELVGVDFVACDAKIDDIGSKVVFPEEWTNIETHNESVPPIFIVNCQLPADFSTSLFKTITDGPGWSLVFYYRITNQTSEQLRDLVSAPGAVRLLAEYCKHAPECDRESNATNNSSHNPWRGRFKVTTRCENIDEFGLPSFITSYNAKPVLIRHTGNTIRGNKYIEIDINIHRFASAPKKALQIMFNRFSDMYISIGFCIESHSDSEMPETLFGCTTLNKISHDSAVKWR